MSSIRNIKILTLLQFCTVVGVLIIAWFYISPHQTTAAPCRGIIDGILYADQGSCILVDGQTLKEGDTLYGIKVLKIDRRIVTFKGNGQQWQQRVRECPSPAWNPPAPPQGQPNPP